MKLKYKLIIGSFAAFSLLVLAIYYLADSDIAVLNPAGPVGQKERNLIIFAASLSLIVVVPVFVMLFCFAWRYREGNKKAKYSPNLDGNLVAESIWWLIPSILILILSVVTWRSSHQLDPFKPLDSAKKPLAIQVVALNWKWLFIYPDQHIASINFVQFPVNTPVNFLITADAPMNSFWIPRLGGQIYAMPGMSTQLHLMAGQTGSFRGSSANISGQGFSGMTFTAKASSPASFNSWLNRAASSPKSLSLIEYDQLVKPSKYDQASYYTLGEAGLYKDILMKYTGPSMEGHMQ